MDRHTSSQRQLKAHILGISSFNQLAECAHWIVNQLWESFQFGMLSFRKAHKADSHRELLSGLLNPHWERFPAFCADFCSGFVDNYVEEIGKHRFKTVSKPQLPNWRDPEGDLHHGTDPEPYAKSFMLTPRPRWGSMAMDRSGSALRRQVGKDPA